MKEKNEMGKIIKMKLEAIEKGQFEIEEMTVSTDDGRVLGVIPAFYYKEYEGQSLCVDTCEVGKCPVFFRVLAIFNLVLPGVVTDIINWVGRDYDGIAKILFYPVTIDCEYESTKRRDLALTLDKKEFHPLYCRYMDILGIQGYSRDELSSEVFFSVDLNGKDLKRVFRSRRPICTLLKDQIEMWKKELVCESMEFVMEYVSAIKTEREVTEIKNKKT